MHTSASISAIALVASAAAAVAQPGPAVRQIGPVLSTSNETFGALLSVRQTKHGVLVNDVANRRLLFFDSTLTNATVVADSTPATANAYGGRIAGLIAYRGDSSLFVDAQTMSMLVIDPMGKVARVMALPRSQDAMALGNTAIGAPGFDGAGRLVYRGQPRVEFRGGGPGGPGGGNIRIGGGGAMPMPEIPDTAPVIRIDLASRVTDTVGFTKTQSPKPQIDRDEGTGRVTITMQVNPLPMVDDFAVLSDGSVALIRGHDYHVDWVRPDGSRESSPKMPFDWQRLTDEDKVAFIDSLKAARERLLAARPEAPAPAASTTTTTTPDGATRTERVMIVGGGPGGPGAAGPGPLGMNSRNINFVPASELPDYKPPFFAGSSRPDADARLWIQTIPTRATAGGTIYDVVNNKGELVERVQLPRDKTIVGFGEGGVVYLATRDGTKMTLERVRAK